MVDGKDYLDRFIQQHQLPDAYRLSVDRCFRHYADWLDTQLSKHLGGAYVLGINGAQGTGKSTLACFLSDYLGHERQRRVAVLSIDDIYLTRDERRALARNIHPLLSIRGVPGTHDVALGIRLLEQLRSLGSGDVARVPVFDKSRDERVAREAWKTVTGSLDLVIFEGWCVGSKATSTAALKKPVNSREATADADASWRTYVNQHLQTDYTQLFALLDGLLYLQAPDFDAVYQWRLKQEQKQQAMDGDATMDEEQVAQFIQLFERITRNDFLTLPSIADAVIRLDHHHRAIALELSS